MIIPKFPQIRKNKFFVFVKRFPKGLLQLVRPKFDNHSVFCIDLSDITKTYGTHFEHMGEVFDGSTAILFHYTKRTNSPYKFHYYRISDGLTNVFRLTRTMILSRIKPTAFCPPYLQQLILPCLASTGWLEWFCCQKWGNSKFLYNFNITLIAYSIHTCLLLSIKNLSISRQLYATGINSFGEFSHHKYKIYPITEMG